MLRLGEDCRWSVQERACWPREAGHSVCPDDGCVQPGSHAQPRGVGSLSEVLGAGLTAVRIVQHGDPQTSAHLENTAPESVGAPDAAEIEALFNSLLD